MSKKEILIIFLTIIIFSLAGLGFFVFLKQKGLVRPPSATETDSDPIAFPSGGEDKTVIKPKENDPDRFVDQEGQDVIAKKGQLIQLTQDSVSGAVSISSTTVKYVDRSSGNVYEVGYTGKNRKRLTNTTILKTFETFWSHKADKAVVRYFEETKSGETSIKNFLIDLSDLTSGDPKEIDGVFLPYETKTIATSPSEDKIFYLTTGSSENEHQGVVANFKNENKKNIFNMDYGDFNASWPSKDIVALVTKPSFMSAGYLYFLNQKTEEFKRILGGIKGLTINVSPDVSKVIYSESNARSRDFLTKLLNISTSEVSNFDFKTLPEKCAWTSGAKAIYCAVPNSLPRADYPDEWYRGELVFSDSIWKKNLVDGTTSVLRKGLGFDAVNLSISEDENYIIFTDKATEILWALKL